MSDVYEPELVESEVVSPTALEAITRAEVDVAVSTAKRYPRSLEKFKARPARRRKSPRAAATTLSAPTRTGPRSRSKDRRSAWLKSA